MQSYREKLTGYKGKREGLKDELEIRKKSVEVLQKEMDTVLEAQTVLQVVAQKTQEELKFRIESIVTMALEAVLYEPYQFEISFEMKRGKTEAECWFVRDGERVSPLQATGGGAVDIASFALRVVFWSLLYQSKKVRPVIVLDEPFRFVSRDLQNKAGQMMKELSDKLGLQFILVTHNRDLEDAADKLIEVSLKDGISKIR